MARVFVSHAGEDRALAGRLHGWLVAVGHEVFLAQDLRDGIALGEEWERQLYAELRRADAVVCVITSAYVASQWCTAEVAIARSRGTRLLPLRAQPGVDSPLLRSIQHRDITGNPDAARAALVEALRQVEGSWPDDRSPFPGLRPFELDQQRVFFGRAEEIAQLTGLLRSPAERAEGAVLLVVVDQFEELLTQTAPAQRARFAELLPPALAGPVQVLATLRPEFLDQLLADPELAGLPTHTYPVRPLRREALRAVIEKPARLAGIDLDEGLAERLVDDTDSGDALPLLAFPWPSSPRASAVVGGCWPPATSNSAACTAP